MGVSSKAEGLREQKPCKCQCPNVRIRNRGMTRSPWKADRGLCRPTAELTGQHSSIKYPGAAPTMQCRTRRAISNSMRSLIGGQCNPTRKASAESRGKSTFLAHSPPMLFNTFFSRSTDQRTCVLISQTT